MFTGIIEEVGEIAAIEDTGEFRTLRVRAPSWMVSAGASIAVNGVCLTVRTFEREFHSRTVARNAGTNEPEIGPGSTVNLERPMRADGRFGGHIVQGHVDGVGRIRKFDRDGDNWNLEVEFPEPGRALHCREGIHRHRRNQPDRRLSRGAGSRGRDNSAYV